MSKRAFVKSVGRQDKGSRPLARVHTTRRGAAMVMVPQRMIASQTEKKNIDVDNPVVLPAFGATTGTLVLLNGVATGTTAVTRLGRRITMRSILIRIGVEVAPTTTLGGSLRYLVVLDKQTNGAAPTAADVLQADAIRQPNNLGNSRRFRTLFDHIEPCVGTGGPQATFTTLYKKLNEQVEFNAGSAGTVADIQTGSVYLFVWHTGTFGVAVPSVTSYSRIRFTDN